MSAMLCWPALLYDADHPRSQVLVGHWHRAYHDVDQRWRREVVGCDVWSRTAALSLGAPASLLCIGDDTPICVTRHIDHCEVVACT